MIRSFIKGEEGQGMVEYGLLAALIAVAVIGVIVAMRTQLSGVFDRITQGLSTQ